MHKTLWEIHNMSLTMDNCLQAIILTIHFAASKCRD